MQKILYCLGFCLLLLSCKEIQKSPSIVKNSKQTLEVKYSNSFYISYFEGYKTITLKNPWPGSTEVFTYALIKDESDLPVSKSFDAIIKTPISSIVVTSTTHIPSLEMLGVSESLVGFPNTDYISSEITRNRVKAGAVKELGKNEDINIEVLIDLSPELVVGFAVDGNNTTFGTIERTGIPVVYNSDWTETSPLGKAEWIKFFAAFFDKEEKADRVFNEIVVQYEAAKKIASEATTRPTVLSGAMYKDIWYLPQGDSWAAQFINDANGNYLWEKSKGKGSLSLNLESVLEKGQSADFWIGPGQFISKEQLRDAHSVYTEFDAYKENTIFSFTNKKGATGGVLYYELAPNRPDLVLKDIIKILHPELNLDHELYFFSHLD